MQARYFGCRINPPSPDIWNPLDIDAPLANAVGGEGGIFNVKGSALIPRVAKIYNDEAKATLGPNAFAALAHLTSKYQQFTAAMPFVAWPMEVLFTEEKPLPYRHLDTLAGITMRRIDGHTVLEKLTTNGTGRVGLGNEAAVRIAATIAGQLNRLHRHGVIFCDFNPRNVLVSHKKDSVVFVDADAFQHGFAHQVFTKPHFTPGYASIDHLNNKPGARTPADDNFVLAIHIFQLLTDGGHPFKTGPKFEPPGGAPLFGEVSPDDNILARRFPYSNVAMFHPPGQTPQHYARLHPELKAMFTRAFQHFQPPTAEEWENILPKFRDSVDDQGSNLQRVNVNAISRPPQYSGPPRSVSQPSAPPVGRPSLSSPQTRVVPPFVPPKPVSPTRRTIQGIGAVAQFFLLLIVTLLRGGPIAVLRLIATMLGTGAYRMGHAYPRATLGTLLAVIAAIFIHSHATPPASRQAPTQAFAPPLYQSRTPIQAPTSKTIAKQAPAPAKKQEAAVTPEVLPWKAQATTTGSTAKTTSPTSPAPGVASTPPAKTRTNAAPSQEDVAERIRRQAEAEARKHAEAKERKRREAQADTGWSQSGNGYRYRDQNGSTLFRITPTH